MPSSRRAEAGERDKVGRVRRYAGLRTPLVATCDDAEYMRPDRQVMLAVVSADDPVLREHRAMRPDDPVLGPTRIAVGCANFEAVARDKQATLDKMDGVIADAAAQGCDLVILPELALNTWGRCNDCADAHQPCAWHRAQAERADGPACRAVADMAAAHGMHVIYGFEETDGDAIYNAANVVAPDGLVGTYRKLFLGIPLETDRFTSRQRGAGVRN